MSSPVSKQTTSIMPMNITPEHNNNNDNKNLIIVTEAPPRVTNITFTVDNYSYTTLYTTTSIISNSSGIIISSPITPTVIGVIIVLSLLIGIAIFGTWLWRSLSAQSLRRSTTMLGQSYDDQNQNQNNQNNNNNQKINSIKSRNGNFGTFCADYDNRGNNNNNNNSNNNNNNNNNKSSKDCLVSANRITATKCAGDKMLEAPAPPAEDCRPIANAIISAANRIITTTGKSKPNSADQKRPKTLCNVVAQQSSSNNNNRTAKIVPKLFLAKRVAKPKPHALDQRFGKLDTSIQIEIDVSEPNENDLDLAINLDTIQAAISPICGSRAHQRAHVMTTGGEQAAARHVIDRRKPLSAKPVASDTSNQSKIVNANSNSTSTSTSSSNNINNNTGNNSKHQKDHHNKWRKKAKRR